MKYHVDAGSIRTTYADVDAFLDAWEQGQIGSDALYWHKGMQGWKPVYQHEIIADALSEVSIRGTLDRAWKLTRTHFGHLTLLTIACLILFAVLSLPMFWWGLEMSKASTRAVHSLVGGKSEGIMEFELPDYAVGWRIGHMAADDTRFIYELVREDEHVENWSEMITVSFASAGVSVDEAAEAFKAGLQASGTSANIVSDDRLDDDSRMVTYSTNIEEGVMRFVLGTDGLHSIAYMVKPEARAEEGWAGGRGVVLGARLSTSKDALPAGGLSPDQATEMNLPLLKIEADEQGMTLKKHPLFQSQMNTILPWPVLLVLYFLLMMCFKVLLDCILYYLARCASLEIPMGKWSEVLSGLRAWKGLVKYNIWNFLILGATMCAPLLLFALLYPLLGSLAGFVMLAGIIPFLYLAMSTYYGPLVVIDRAAKTFGGKVNAWRAFWDTRRRLSPYWLILLVILIICAVAGSVVNGLVLLGVSFLGAMLPHSAVVVPVIAILIGPLVQMVVLLAMAVNYRSIFADENPDLPPVL